MDIKFIEAECLKVARDEILIMKFPKETSGHLLSRARSLFKDKYPKIDVIFMIADCEFVKIKKDDERPKS